MGREAIYQVIAKSCIDAAQKRAMSSEIIALSDIATCIMTAYPDDIGPILNRPRYRTQLNNLRGVAVYVKYGMPDVVDDIGSAFPQGRIAENCQSFSFADTWGLQPVRICHTALLCAVERDTSIEEGSPPLP